MERLIEQELLDSLHAEDPSAMRSRRELRLINAIMGNHRWLETEIRRRIQPGWRVLELGSGDGTFGSRLVAKGVCEEAQLAGMDIAPRPARWPAAATWIQGDVRANDWPDAEIVVANLFLHHFEMPTLAQLGSRLPKGCRVLLASEPARRSLHLAQGRLLAILTLFGPVTRHDMLASIRAGFLRDELGQSLGISNWNCRSTDTVFGAHRLRAERP